MIFTTLPPEQLAKAIASFERDYCCNNRDAIRKNSTTDDYVLPSIQDAFAGWLACWTLLNKEATNGSESTKG